MFRFHFLSTAIFLALICCSCNNKHRAKPAKTDTSTQKQTAKKEHKITDWQTFGSGYRLKGDFDGDGKKDSLFTIVMNTKFDTVVEKIPVFDNNWYSNDYLFDNVETALYMKGADTLWLQLYTYCVINLGDVSKKNKDLIAIVDGEKDMSRLNSCEIYRLENRKWKRVFEFEVTELAFILQKEERNKVFTDIPNFLEKRKGYWYYSDLQDQEGSPQLWHKLHIK